MNTVLFNIAAKKGSKMVLIGLNTVDWISPTTGIGQ